MYDLIRIGIAKDMVNFNWVFLFQFLFKTWIDQLLISTIFFGPFIWFDVLKLR